MSERNYDRGQYSGKLGDNSMPLWYYGVVISIDDPFDAGRIMVRAEGLDKKLDLIGGGKSKEELKNLGKSESDAVFVWVEPMMPKFINVVPKVGEMVKIVLFDYKNKQWRRQYIGPVIGQQNPSNLQNSDYDVASSQVNFKSFKAGWKDNPNSSVGDWKIYPNKDDIALLGRRNTDIILRNKADYDEIILRAGEIDYRSIQNIDGSGKTNLNKKNPAYIIVNHTWPKTNSSALQSRIGLDKDRTHINVVADRLNLISHIGSSVKGKSKTIINGENYTEQILTENTKLHPLVYGDVIWEFMVKMRAYVEGHIHKGSRREPDGDQTKNDLINWFNKNMGKQSSKPNPDGTSYTDIDDCKFLSKGVKTN